MRHREATTRSHAVGDRRAIAGAIAMTVKVIL